MAFALRRVQTDYFRRARRQPAPPRPTRPELIRSKEEGSGTPLTGPGLGGPGVMSVAVSASSRPKKVLPPGGITGLKFTIPLVPAALMPLKETPGPS